MTRCLAAPLLTLLLTLALAPAGATEPPLGRLFYAPEKRAALDQQRALNQLQNRQAIDGSATVTLNGVLRRSSGRHTEWVNGVANPGGERSRQLRVGDTLDPASGERQGLLRGGRLTIGSPNKSRTP